MKIRPIEISDYNQIRRIGQQCIDLHRKYKRGGYGSKLYEFIIDLVHDLGATELTTTIYGFNDTCFRFADSTRAVFKKAELTYSI